MSLVFGRYGMKQMYELEKNVTVNELWISNFFLKPNFVSTVNIPYLTKLKEAPKTNWRPTLVTPPGSPFL